MPKKVEIHQALANKLSSPLESIRSRRRFIEQEWLKNYAAWQGWPNTQYYVSLADDSVRYFIPALRRALERTNSRIIKLLTPKTKWFEVQPFDDTSHANSESVDNYMRFITRKKIPFRRNLSALSRCMLLYNFAILRSSVSVDAEGLVWPSQRTVDPFSFYVYPENAMSTDQAMMMFEDIIMPSELYQSYVDANLALPLANETLSNPVWPYHLIERFAYRGLSNPSDFSSGFGNIYDLRKKQVRDNLSAMSSSFVSLTDIWFKKSSQWFNAWLVTNTSHPTLVRLDMHEVPPNYKWSTHRPLPNELYTNSAADDARVLQTLFNNQVSQTEEARQMATTGPVALNAQNRRSQQYKWGNREIWYVDGDVRETFARPTYQDTSPSGLRGAQVTLGLLNSMLGSGTIAEGQPGRNMPRAGFAVNNLINLSLSDTQDIAETQEQDILTPSLADIHYQTMMYVPQDQMIRIPGTQEFASMMLRKDDLLGDYTYEWVGSLEFQDREVKAERLMLFLKLLIDGMPFIQQAGYKVNLPKLIQSIYAYGIGERGMGDILQEMSPEEMVLMPQTAQQENGQGKDAQQGNARGNGNARANGASASSFDQLMQSLQSIQGEV